MCVANADNYQQQTTDGQNKNKIIDSSGLQNCDSRIAEKDNNFNTIVVNFTGNRRKISRNFYLQR